MLEGAITILTEVGILGCETMSETTHSCDTMPQSQWFVDLSLSRWGHQDDEFEPFQIQPEKATSPGASPFVSVDPLNFRGDSARRPSSSPTLGRFDC